MLVVSLLASDTKSLFMLLVRFIPCNRKEFGEVKEVDLVCDANESDDVCKSCRLCSSAGSNQSLTVANQSSHRLDSIISQSKGFQKRSWIGNQSCQRRSA